MRIFLKLSILFMLIGLSGQGALAQTGTLTPTIPYGLRWAGRWIGVNTSDGLWVYDSENLQAPRHVLSGQKIPHMRFDPTGTYAALVISTTEGDALTVLDLATGETVLDIIPPMEPPRMVGAFAFDQTGERLVVPFGHHLALYNLTTLESELTYYHPSPAGIWHVGFGPLDNTLFITDDAKLGVYRIADLTYNPEAQPVLEYALPPDSRGFQMVPGSPVVFVTSGSDLYTMSLSSGELTLVFESMPLTRFSTPTADGSMYAYSMAGSWGVLDVATRTIIAEYTFADNTIYLRALATDSTTLVGLQSDDKVMLWNLTNPNIVTELANFAS